MDDLKELYNSNGDFRRYVDRYSVSRGISPEEALDHALVKEYAKSIKEKESTV